MRIFGHINAASTEISDCYGFIAYHRNNKVTTRFSDSVNFHLTGALKETTALKEYVNSFDRTPFYTALTRQIKCNTTGFNISYFFRKKLLANYVIRTLRS